MPLDVHGTFVSQKISKVRWIPEEYVETKCFFTGSWDDDVNSVKVWNLDSQDDEEVEYPKCLSEFPVDGDVTEIKFTSKNRIAVSTSDGDVRLLEISMYERSQPLKEVFKWEKLHKFGGEWVGFVHWEHSYNGHISNIQYADAMVPVLDTPAHTHRLPTGPSGLTAASCHGNCVYVFSRIQSNKYIDSSLNAFVSDFLSWGTFVQSQIDDRCCCTAVATMDSDIASIGEDGNINFLNGHRGDVIRTVTGADSCSLHSVCFIKYNEIITGNLRGHMKIWDMRSTDNKPTASFILAGDDLAATCIASHPTQPHIILAGSESGSLAIWDLRMNSFPTSLLNAHAASVTEMQFHPVNPSKLISCSVSGEIWEWNMEAMIKTTQSSDNEVATWMPLEDKNTMVVNSLMPTLHKAINTVHCDRGRILCGADNEAVYLINNFKY